MNELKNMTQKTGLKYIFFLSIPCLASQIFFIRGLLTLFNGSEYIISFFWLLWFASNILGVAAGKLFNCNIIKLKILVFFYLIILPISLIVIKFAYQFFSSGNSSGASIKALIFSFAAICIPCFINGYIFSTFLKKMSYPKSIKKLYASETAGFCIAGILTHISVEYFNDFYILILLSAIAAILLLLLEKSYKLKFMFFISIIFFIFCVAIYKNITKKIMNSAMPGFNFLEEINTGYGKIDVFTHTGGIEKFGIYSGVPLVLDVEEGADEEIIFTAAALTKENPAILFDGIIKSVFEIP